MRRHHDMGGLEAEAIDPCEHDYAPWEKKVDAILRILASKGLITVDELRRGIEEIGSDAYDRMSYYERWITSVTNNLLEKRIVAPSELGDAMEAVHQRHRGA